MVALPARAGIPLRHVLKKRTADLHDTLDRALGGTLTDGAGYGAFLRVQHSARAPIERWAASHMDPALRPPPMAPLIAADLAELGVGLPPDQSFSGPDRAGQLGMAWALGGSALGNKALLAQRRRAGQIGADRFLSDTATATYFRRILPLLAGAADDVEADAAVAAAQAIFATFLTAATRGDFEVAA